MNCYVHSEASAVGTCVGCGKFICEECNTQIEGKNYCKSCVSDLVKVQREALNKPEAEKKSEPIIISNNASSSASAAASSSSSNPRRGPYPKQNCLIHILLLCFTGGIGNIIYFFYIRGRQKNY